MKFIFHLVIFAAGAGVGIWWGVNHPTAAANIATNEEAKVREAVAKAKIEVLDKVLTNQTAAPTAHTEEYKQMRNDQQNQLTDAKKQLGQ